MVVAVNGPTHVCAKQTQLLAIPLQGEMLNAQLNRAQAELGDDALAHIAEHLREELEGESLEDVRRALRQVLVRVDLVEKEMTLHYVSPLVERPKTIIAPGPPWEFECQFWG